jgi:hypothetical protein
MPPTLTPRFRHTVSNLDLLPAHNTFLAVLVVKVARAIADYVNRALAGCFLMWRQKVRMGYLPIASRQKGAEDGQGGDHDAEGKVDKGPSNQISVLVVYGFVSISDSQMQVAKDKV